MSDDEFKHLQNFGKTIENQSVKEPKESKPKNNFSFKFDKKKINYNFKKIYKRIIFTKIRLKKHIDGLNFKKIKLPKVDISIPKTKKNYVRCYRIIEKKKQRRNKITIVRKRVPFKIDFSELDASKTDLDDLFSFTFESGLYFNRQKTTENHKLKSSIWDFKIK